MILKSNQFDESLYNDSLFDVHRMSVMNHTISYLGVIDEYTEHHLSPLSFYKNGKSHLLANPLFSLIKVNDVFLNPKFIHPLEHEKIYDIDRDLFSRKTVYDIEDTKVTIKSERFIDQSDQIIYAKYEFFTDKPITIDLYQGIDDKYGNIEILDENKDCSSKEISISSNDGKDKLVLRYKKDFRHKARPSQDKTVEHYQITTEENRTYTVYKYVGIGKGISRLNSKMNQDFSVIKEVHCQNQKSLLETYRLTIVSNDDVQTKTDFATRHLLRNRCDFKASSMNPLSIFFMVYAHSIHQPKRAKTILKKQLARLKDAIAFAKKSGYKGAFYGPRDFIEGENHILDGAMLLYSLDRYIKLTEDESLLEKGGLEMMVEVSTFYANYATYIDANNHYAFLNLANIDGSTQHINYHSLTHILVRYALMTTKKYVRKHKFKVSRKKLDLINQVSQQLYQAQANSNNLLLPYKDYLQDDDNDLLVMVGKKVDISADQLLAFTLFRDKYSEKVVKSSLDFFKKRFVYNLKNQWIQSIVPMAEMSRLAVKQFNKVTSLNKNSLLVSEKGVDKGVCALIYYMVVHGYAGFRKENEYFSVDTQIPSDIRRVEFWMTYKDYKADIKIKRNSARLEWRMED